MNKKIIAVNNECIIDIIENSKTQKKNPSNKDSNVSRFIQNYHEDIDFLILITILIPSLIYLIPYLITPIPVSKPSAETAESSCKALGYTGTPSTSLGACKKDPVCLKTFDLLKGYHTALQKSGFQKNRAPITLEPNITIQIVPSTKDTPFLSEGPQYDEPISLQFLQDIEGYFNSRIKAIQTHFEDMPIARLRFNVNNHILLDKIKTKEKISVDNKGFDSDTVKESTYKPNTFLMPIGYFNPERMKDRGGFYRYKEHTYKINEKTKESSTTHEITFPVGYAVIRSDSKTYNYLLRNFLIDYILHEISHAWLNHGYPYSDKDNYYQKAGYYQEGILSKLFDPTLSKKERLPYAHAYKAICISNVMVYTKYCVDQRFLNLLTSPSLYLREYFSGTFEQRDTIRPHTIPHILARNLNQKNKTSYIEKLAKCDILNHFKEQTDWLLYALYFLSGALYNDLIRKEFNEIFKIDSKNVFSGWDLDTISSIGIYRKDYTTKSISKTLSKSTCTTMTIDESLSLYQ